jgi:asparagine synthase (glutamine-hydrolysing)
MLKHGHEEDFNRFIKEDVKGEFAFVLFEFDRLKNLSNVIVARDEIGVRPLYYTPDSTDTLFFSSEVKGGLSQSHKIMEFPPGHIFNYELDELGNITCDKYNYSTVYDTEVKKYKDETHLENVQFAVLNSIRRRLCADKPLAFLLSGGVDSSLTAAVSSKILGKPIRTFCCGIRSESGEGVGTDLKYARMVAKHIGSQHTEVLFTPEEALAAIPDVIRTIESWDTTSIRASVGQYLVCKWIGENTDCRVLLVGEGPDEVCSSYLFNWYATDGDALDKCAKEYVKNIHYYDVKRADRCIARHGLEGRVPFLDPEFIEAYWAIPGEKRMPTYKKMEKWFLRKAFDGTGVLPTEVLFRTKEAFSDGVSGEKSWFQIIQEWVEDKVTDEELAGAAEKYPYCTPQTKEAYYYRRIFCEIFGEERQTIIPQFWLPKWDKEGKEVTQYVDPSARTLSVYNSLK